MIPSILMTGNPLAKTPGSGILLANNLVMTVAFDIASFPIFKDGDLYYPGVASLLAIINCGGRALIYSSGGTISRHEKGLISKLTGAFGGKIIYAHDGFEADMQIT